MAEIVKNLCSVFTGPDKEAIRARLREHRRFSDAPVDHIERMMPHLPVIHNVMSMRDDGLRFVRTNAAGLSATL